MTARAAWARAGLVAGVVLVLDQVTKALVRGGLRVGEEDPVLPALKLVHVRNEGVAFGIDVGGQAPLIVLILLALVALVVFFSRRTATRTLWLPVGLLLGGAIGNVVDRVHQGHVTDFLKLPKWPAFNVADIAIVAGVLVLVLVLERRDARASDHA